MLSKVYFSQEIKTCLDKYDIGISISGNKLIVPMDRGKIKISAKSNQKGTSVRVYFAKNVEAGDFISGFVGGIAGGLLNRAFTADLRQNIRLQREFIFNALSVFNEQSSSDN